MQSVMQKDFGLQLPASISLTPCSNHPNKEMKSKPTISINSLVESLIKLERCESYSICNLKVMQKSGTKKFSIASFIAPR